MLYRLRHSYLFAIALGTTASILCAFFLPVAAIPTAIICGCLTLAYAYCNWKKLRYEMTLSRNIFLAALKGSQRKWWNHITPHIILGAIPLKNKDHQHKLLTTANVGAVLSVVEPFEIHNLGIFSEPVSPSDWTDRQIDHLLIATPDFHPISLDQIDCGVEFMRAAIQQKKVIYVHCKAGRGRSTTMVICYLLKYEKAISVDEAFKAVKRLRPHIIITPKQKQAISEYYKSYCNGV